MIVTKLKPIKETPSDFEAVEKKIKALFKDEIYIPLMRELSRRPRALTNSLEDLHEAIRDGEIFYARGRFRGAFDSSLSLELKELGAVWDRKESAWIIPLSALPPEIKAAISATAFRFNEKLKKIDAKLSQMLPEEIADKISLTKQFDATLWKTDREFMASVRGIAIPPQLTKEMRAKIALEWQNNLKLYIRDFTDTEIKRLRREMQETVFAGDRYGSAIKKIRESYDVSQNKAKFLARQETSLLMTKFKETRYTDAGVNWYEWRCVVGSKAHPVRPWHKALENKKFRWDSPPVTTEPGKAVRRNNPGQDFNCRCFALPLVNYRGGDK